MTNRKWDRIRAKGRLHYSLTDGLLLKGSCYLVAFGVSSPFVFDNTASFLEALPYAVVALPLAGFASNLLAWNVYEAGLVEQRELLREAIQKILNWFNRPKTTGKKTSHSLRPRTA